MIEVGVMQGRLSPQPQDRLQAFPWLSWESEFDLARECGFRAIEWIFEADRHEQNPILNDGARKRIAELTRETGVGVRSICADYFMTFPLFNPSESERLHSVRVLEELIDAAPRVGAKTILIPVLERSALRTNGDRALLLETLRGPLVLAAQNGVMIGIEAELDAAQYADLIDGAASPAVGAYYDTGNAAAQGHDVANDLTTLGSRVCGVHFKDRGVGGPSVPLGQGAVDFERTLTSLQRMRFNGLAIVQSTSGPDPVAAASSHLSFVNKVWCATSGSSL